jgi:copper chaperone NosL
MMNHKASPASRLIVLAAALAMILMYFLPLWKIDLQAPQYPEGIGLLIRIDTIEGVGPHDLKNINGLNHYIGMKEIVPDAIPELTYMPFILGGLILWGVLAAATGRRWLLYTWFGALALSAVAGLVDFYLWGYDYGHNLNAETAIIKIPGMTYQPPLIGTKNLLNFTATSLPAIGGWIAIAAGGAVGWRTWTEWRSGRKAPREAA